MIRKIGYALGAAGAYLLAIMPRRGQRAGKMKGVFYAHRGLHDREAGVPENTLPAFARAAEAGYGMELDIQLSKDGQVVVFHDTTLKRLCGVDGKVRDYTYEELRRFPIDGTGERIPLFSEVLALVDGRVPLLVELKCPDTEPLVCPAADRLLQAYQGEYVIESFNPWVLMWYRKYRPEVCRGQLSMNFQRQEGSYSLEKLVERHLLTNFLTKPDFIAYDIRDEKAFSKNLCRKLFGCPSAAWTVRSFRQLQKARKYYDAFIFEGFRPPVRNPS